MHQNSGGWPLGAFFRSRSACSMSIVWPLYTHWVAAIIQETSFTNAQRTAVFLVFIVRLAPALARLCLWLLWGAFGAALGRAGVFIIGPAKEPGPDDFTQRDA